MYGALLGVQEGRNIEICNSFELLVNLVDGRVTHDAEYFNAKEKQCVCVCACVLPHGSSVARVCVCMCACLYNKNGPSVWMCVYSNVYLNHVMK